MRWKVSLLMVLFSCSAYAGPEAWMKQSNPNSLGLFVVVSSSCPFAREGLVDRIEGEFLRARIKPSKSLNLYLSVDVLCMSVSDSSGAPMGSAVSYEMRYGARTPHGVLALYSLPNYGSMMVGGKDSNLYFINAITDKVSLSLTDYLKANL